MKVTSGIYNYADYNLNDQLNYTKCEYKII